MLSSQKLLIIIGLAGLGLILVLIFSFPRPLPPEEAAIPGPGLPLVAAPKFEPSGSALIPPTPEIGPFLAPSGVGGETTGSAFLLPEKPKFEANIPSIEDITKAVGDVLGQPSVTPPATALLELPAISDAALNIVPDGPSQPIDYVESFAVGAFEGVEFDGARFANVLMDENNLPLLPQQLIERGVASGSFAELKSSLSVFRDFVVAKDGLVKSLPVSGEAIGVAKEIISFDTLTLLLIDKAIAAAEGKVSILEVKDFYQKFEATSDFRREKFLRSTGLISYGESGLFRKIAKFLAGGNVALAQVPFGTFIGPPIFCVCSVSFWIPTGPPIPAPTGFLNAHLSWISSPAFFPFRALRPGAAWLGNYSGAFTCNQPPSCQPVGIGNIPIIAGTSL